MPTSPLDRTRPVKPLNETEKYLVSLRELMREAVKKTQHYDAKWNRLNDEMNDYLDRKGETDIVQRAHIKEMNLPLNDAYAAGQWWRGKASYLALVIQAEVALRGGVGLS